jgi:hypothetical protein
MQRIVFKGVGGADSYGKRGALRGLRTLWKEVCQQTSLPEPGKVLVKD